MRVWKKRDYGDISAIFTWHDDDPALCLSYCRRGYVLPMRRLHEVVYGGERVNPEGVFALGVAAAEVWGEPLKAARAADIILNSVEELLRMPPAPERNAKMFDEVSIRED